MLTRFACLALLALICTGCNSKEKSDKEAMSMAAEKQMQPEEHIKIATQTNKTLTVDLNSAPGGLLADLSEQKAQPSASSKDAPDTTTDESAAQEAATKAEAPAETQESTQSSEQKSSTEPAASTTNGSSSILQVDVPSSSGGSHIPSIDKQIEKPSANKKP